MAVTPKGIVTPDPSSPYNLVTDLNTLASTADAAIVTQKGTASQRAAAMAGAPEGAIWQDTDGIKMIWRKDGAAWVPAVWRWAGSTAQMSSFTQAPIGFEWYNSSDALNYVKFSSGWRASAKILTGRVTLTPPSGGGVVDATVSFPSGFFTAEPLGFATIQTGITGSGVVFATVSDETVNGMRVYLNRTNGTTTNIKWQAVQS